MCFDRKLHDSNATNSLPSDASHMLAAAHMAATDCGADVPRKTFVSDRVDEANRMPDWKLYFEKGACIQDVIMKTRLSTVHVTSTDADATAREHLNTPLG
jgi:hypothetical protein